MFKVNNRNTRTKCEICTKLTIKRPERRQAISDHIIIPVNFEDVKVLLPVQSQIFGIFLLFLLFLLLTLCRFARILQDLKGKCN